MEWISIVAVLTLLVNHGSANECGNNTEHHTLTEMPHDGFLECSSLVQGSYWLKTGIQGIICEDNSKQIKCSVGSIANNDIVKLTLLNSNGECIKECTYVFSFFTKDPIVMNSSSMLSPTMVSITFSQTGSSSLSDYHVALSTTSTSTSISVTMSLTLNVTVSTTSESPTSSALTTAVIASVSVICVATMSLIISGIMLWICTIAKRRRKKDSDINNNEEVKVGQTSDFMIGETKQELFKDVHDSLQHKNKKPSVTDVNPFLKHLMDGSNHSRRTSNTSGTPVMVRRDSETSGVHTASSQEDIQQTMSGLHNDSDTDKLLLDFEEDFYKRRNAEIKRTNPLLI